METNLLFVYGILKRGHGADLRRMGAEFIAEASLKNSQLYWLSNRAGVGLRFELDKGPSRGEVFLVENPKLWDYLDEIEGVDHGVYKRIRTYPVQSDGSAPEAWVYAHTFYDDRPKMYNDPIPNNWF